MSAGILDVVLRVPAPELVDRAEQFDFAIASRLDRLRAQLLHSQRLNVVSGRLEAQIDALDELQEHVPQDAARDLQAQKGQLQWLLSELRRNS